MLVRTGPVATMVEVVRTTVGASVVDGAAGVGVSVGVSVGAAVASIDSEENC